MMHNSTIKALVPLLVAPEGPLLLLLLFSQVLAVNMCIVLYTIEGIGIKLYLAIHTPRAI